MVAEIRKEEVQEWLLHPVTKAFKTHLHNLRESLKEQWALGGFSEDTEFKNAVKQAQYLGQAELLRELLDLDGLHSAINEDPSNEE